VQAIGSSEGCQTYTLGVKSYHQVSDALVLAWQLRGCRKDGKVPLWDACLIKLGGFSAFDYLGQSSVSGQAELRWRTSIPASMVCLRSSRPSKNALLSGSSFWKR
jgi:hypothetical protein